MALPLLILAPLVAYGASKIVKAGMDHKQASDKNESAKSIVSRAQEKVQICRERTESILTKYGEHKLRAFEGPIAVFVDSFGKLTNVEYTSIPEFGTVKLNASPKVMLKELHRDYELLLNSGMGLGTGAASGAALAFGAYNGTMLLATASTGTAISTLSGAAATNATLAWLGGGSIAAGGGGVAAGTMVLGGIVAAPALAIFGHIIGNKAEAAVAQAESNIEMAKTVELECKQIMRHLTSVSQVAWMLDDTLSKLVARLRRSSSKMNDVIAKSGTDFSQFTDEEKDTVFRAVKYAQLVKVMVDTPILDENGGLVPSAETQARDIRSEMKLKAPSLTPDATDDNRGAANTPQGSEDIMIIPKLPPSI